MPIIYFEKLPLYICIYVYIYIYIYIYDRVCLGVCSAMHYIYNNVAKYTWTMGPISGSMSAHGTYGRLNYFQVIVIN